MLQSILALIGFVVFMNVGSRVSPQYNLLDIKWPKGFRLPVSLVCYLAVILSLLGGFWSLLGISLFGYVLGLLFRRAGFRF